MGILTADTLPRRGRDVQDLVGLSNCGDVLNIGPFDTQEAAETWLREDAVKAFSGSGSPVVVGDQEDFGSVHFICEVKRAVKPVPAVVVEASLQDL